MQVIGRLALFNKIFFLLIFFYSINCSAQDYPDLYIHNILRSGIDDIINQNYSQAKLEFEKLNSKYPDLPLGKIYLSAVEIARAYDYGDEYNDHLIMEYLNAACEQAEKLEKNKPELWNYYFLGLAEGYISYYKGLTGSWLSSINSAMNSVSNFEECIKLNSGFVEAYSGIGNYKYWKSKKTESLNWLPFVHDERAEGIELLEKAVNKSSYNTDLAVNSLIWIYINLKNYNEAAHIAEKALKKYPASRLFKWGLARAYEEIDRSKAIHYYYDILNSFPNLSGMNRYNEIVLKHIIAQQYAKSGEKLKALILCNEILAIKNLSESVKSKLGDRLDRIKDLQMSLLK
jgi:tetratricopeptide (TPR) repeat protein